MRLASSPFRVDQNAYMNKRMEDRKVFLQRKNDKINNKKLLSGMIGKPDFDLVTPDVIKSTHDPEKKLALELRSTLKTLAVVCNEEATVRDILDAECNYIIKAFPVMALHAEKMQNSRLANILLLKSRPLSYIFYVFDIPLYYLNNICFFLLVYLTIEPRLRVLYQEYQEM